MKLSRRFGDDAGKLYIVAVDEGENLFNAAALNAIRQAVCQLEQIEEVERVTAFIDAPRLRPPAGSAIRKAVSRVAARRQLLAGKLPPVPDELPRYWPDSEDRQATVDLQRLKSAVLKDERIVGRLLAADATAHVMLVAIAPEMQLTMPRQYSLGKEIESILKGCGVGKRSAFVSGLPVTNGSLAAMIESTFQVLLPMACLIVGLFIYCVFRELRIGLLMVALGGMSVIWALGLTSLVFGELTIVAAASPLVILAVSTTDFLHMTSAYQQVLARGLKKEEAIRQVLVEVGGACLLTSLTTFVGFGSLMLTVSPAVRQFGFAAAVGTAVALLLMVTLLPLAYRFMRPLPVARVLITDRFIDRFLCLCDQITARFPGLILAGFVLICLPGGLLLIDREFDANIAARFPDTHPIQRSLTLLEDKFTGGNSFELYVSGPVDELMTPETLRTLAAFRDIASREAHVMSVDSVIDLFRDVNRVIGYRTDDGLPTSQTAMGTSVDWVEAQSPKLVRSYITADRDQLRIRVMLGSLGMRATNQLAMRMATQLSQMLRPSLSVTRGGTYQIIGAVVDNIVHSQITGFFVCMVSLTVIMIWGLGSVRVGLMAQIPNVIPVLLMMVVVALTQDIIDSDILALPMIGLGIAVDDTVHFLHRLRLESERTPDRRVAVTSVFAVTGRSIVISTIGLSAALLPLAAADIISIWMMGTYLVVALFGALISDLLCLPAMIHLGLIRYQFTEQIIPTAPKSE